MYMFVGYIGGISQARSYLCQRIECEIEVLLLS